MDYLYYNVNAGADDDVEFWYAQLEAAGLHPQRPPLSESEAIHDLGRDDRLFIAGGDGTINFVARACADAGCLVGVLPAGTANDFARGLGIGADVPTALGVLVSGVEKAIDLARVNERVFVNVAHIGIGASVSKSLQGDRKSNLGRFSYFAQLAGLFEGKRGFRAEVVAENQKLAGRWLAISVANGNSFGGGYPVLNADPCDALLDVVAVKPQPLSTLFLEWMRIHIVGLAPRPAVLKHLRAASIEINTRKNHRIAADGEDAGSTPAEFSLEPGVLRVLVPHSPDIASSSGLQVSD